MAHVTDTTENATTLEARLRKLEARLSPSPEWTPSPGARPRRAFLAGSASVTAQLPGPPEKRRRVTLSATWPPGLCGHRHGRNSLAAYASSPVASIFWWRTDSTP
jgi:hypothetical protein